MFSQHSAAVVSLKTNDSVVYAIRVLSKHDTALSGVVQDRTMISFTFSSIVYLVHRQPLKFVCEFLASFSRTCMQAVNC